MKTFPVFRLQFHGRRRTILRDPCAFCGAGPVVPGSGGPGIPGLPRTSVGVPGAVRTSGASSNPLRSHSTTRGAPRSASASADENQRDPQGSGPEATTSPDLPGQVIGAVGQHRVRTSADPTKGSRVAGAGVEPHRPSLHVVRTLPIQPRDNISHPVAALSGPKDE